MGVASILTNFAIGNFILAGTDSLRLTGSVANALYVGVLDIGGLANTNNLTLDVNLYYDANQAANAYLGGLAYDLDGAGQLLPYPGFVIPEPSSLGFMALAGAGLMLRRKRPRVH